MPCSELEHTAPCELSKNEIDFDFLIDNGFMSKEEVYIYKLAEKNGFDVSIKNDFKILTPGIFCSKFKIEITKSKYL